MKRLPFFLSAAALLALSTLAAAQIPYSQKEGDAQYSPEVGQSGKDVIWVPTPAALATAMLRAAQVKTSDIVYDLGSGDGRIAIAAAKEFGATGYGIEFNPAMVALARRNAQRAGVGGKVSFVQGDIFKTDFSKATVVTMYLLPSLNLRLRDTILAMRPGTRVVSHAFDMGDWAADQTIEADSRTAYLWIVPANVGGRWTITRGARTEPLVLAQSYQMLSGTVGGRSLRGGRVRGGEVTLHLADGAMLSGRLGPGVIIGDGWSARRAG